MAASEPDYTKIVDDVVAKMRDAFPPSHPATGAVHEVSPRMSENGNGGSTQALRVEVEGIKGQFHDFREETNARFSALSSDIRGISKALGDFIQTQGSRGGESLYKVMGLLGTAVVIVLGVLGSFGGLAKTNLDTNIAYTNEKIRDTNGIVRDLASTVRDLANTTIPRPELEVRINATRDAVAGLAKKVDDNVVPRSEYEHRMSTIADDLKTLKADTLKREDLDGRFADVKTRADLNTARTVKLEENTAGVAVLQEQYRSLANQVTELRTRALAAIPPKQ